MSLQHFTMLLHIFSTFDIFMQGSLILFYLTCYFIIPSTIVGINTYHHGTLTMLLFKPINQWNFTSFRRLTSMTTKFSNNLPLYHLWKLSKTILLPLWMCIVLLLIPLSWLHLYYLFFFGFLLLFKSTPFTSMEKEIFLFSPWGYAPPIFILFVLDVF